MIKKKQQQQLQKTHTQSTHYYYVNQSRTGTDKHLHYEKKKMGTWCLKVHKEKWAEMIWIIVNA